MNLDELKTIESKVEYLLERYPQTRNSDKVLLMNLYSMFYNVNILDTFASVLLDPLLPDYGSVSRARRKIQARREELRAEDKVEECRINIQAEYIEYAMGDR